MKGFRKSDLIQRRVLDTKALPYVEGYFAGQNQHPENEEGVWDYFSEEGLFPYFCAVPGQHQTSGLGELLTIVVANSEGPAKLLEIGTWNGLGTTYCLLEGLRMRSDKSGVQLVSYEADPYFYRIAQKNLEQNPFYGTYLTLVYGRLPGTFEFPSPSEIPDSEKGPGGHFHLNYEREKYIFQVSPQVELPFEPEMVVLDGGEYTGTFDWSSIPRANLKYVFLDDIQTRKNQNVYAELAASPEWALWKEHREEGNGWAVFERV